MSNKNKKMGFSLIELMVSMIAAGILALTVSLMLSYGWKSWFTTNEAVDMQRDSTLVDFVVTREIRSSAMDDITISANRIDFAAAGVRTQPEAIFLSGGNIVHSGPDGSFVLTRGTATRFEALKQADHVVVWIELDAPNGGFSIDKNYVVYTRNES